MSRLVDRNVCSMFKKHSLFSVPIDETPGISILYIFVDIQVNIQHIVETLKHHFNAESKLALVSTIQFVRSLQVCH